MRHSALLSSEGEMVNDYPCSHEYLHYIDSQGRSRCGESPQTAITRRPFVRNTVGGHSHRFTPPDSIADEDYVSPEELERQLREIETHGAKGLTKTCPVTCPGCGAPNVYEHHDGIIACALCPQMWAAEEFQASRVGIRYVLKAYP